MKTQILRSIILLLFAVIICSPAHAQENDSRLERQKQAIIDYCSKDTYTNRTVSNPNNLSVRRTAEGVPFRVEKVTKSECSVFTDTGELYKKEFFWTSGKGGSEYPENYIWEYAKTEEYVVTGNLKNGNSDYRTPRVTETEGYWVPGKRTVEIWGAQQEKRVKKIYETKWIKKDLIKKTSKEIPQQN